MDQYAVPLLIGWFIGWFVIHWLCYVSIGPFLLPSAKGDRMRESLRLVAVVHSVFAFFGAATRSRGR